MKISNEERREVAMSLRTAKQSELWRLSDGELIDTVADAIGVDGMSRHYEAALFDRLADLIDRETCRNVSGDQNRFECSECGFEMPTWDGDGGWMAFYFCPNCGAKVVSDED